MDFNFQSINGEDEILSSGYGWHEEQEEVSNTESDSEAGPKPYPTEWNTGESTVYKDTFERYSGVKYIGLDDGGQVRNETDISNGVLLEESRLMPEFTIELNDEPRYLLCILIRLKALNPLKEIFLIQVLITGQPILQKMLL